MGNLVENPHVGMLFIDFADPSRVRVSGRATISDDAGARRDVPGRPVRRPRRRRRGVPELPALHPPDGRSAAVRVRAGGRRHRRRCPTGSGRRGPATCSPPTIPPVTDGELSRRTFLALGATVVVAACSVGRRRPRRSPATRPGVDDEPRRRRPTTARDHRDHVDDDVAPRWPPTRSRSASAPAIPTTRRRCCGPASSATARRRGRRRRGRSPATSRFAAITATGTATAHVPPTATACTSSPSSTGRRGTGSAPAGSPARSAAPRRPAATRRRCAWRRRRASTGETGFYAAHRDIAEWAPDLVVFLGDFIYEYAARPSATTGCAPTTAPSRPTSPATGPATPSTSPIRDLRSSRAAARGCVDLGRPRGGEQLRRAGAAGPGRAGDVRRPPRRRLPGVVGAHAGAPARPRRRRRLPDRTARCRSAGWST